MKIQTETLPKLLVIVEALARLSRDEQFMAILEDEGLDTIPGNLAYRLRGNSEH